MRVGKIYKSFDLMFKSLQFTFLVVQCLFNHRLAIYFCLSLERIYVRPGHPWAILNEVDFFWSSFSNAFVFRPTLTNFIRTPSDCRRLLTITCSCAIFRLSKKVRRHLYGESLSRVEGAPSPPYWVNFWERFYEKIWLNALAQPTALEHALIV